MSLTHLTALGKRLRAGMAAAYLARALSYPADTAPAFDYSAWLAVYESYTGNNSQQNWDDLSGNGRHLMPYDAAYPFNYITSAHTGKPAFTTEGTSDPQHCAWYSPATFSATPADYTQVAAFRLHPKAHGRVAMLRQASNPNRYTWAAVNSGYALAQDDTPAGDNIDVVAEQVVILVVEFRQAGGATITLNGQVVASGVPYAQIPITLLLVFNQSQNFVVQGEHYAFALALGINAARTAALVSKWKADLNLTF